jgi:hypothetical protein
MRSPATGPARSLALVTQMRAGTHYMCAALRVALAASFYRPGDGGRYIAMSDDEIVKGLHSKDALALPVASLDRQVYFSHYFHPHHHALAPMPRISLIGFPFDSFYSDGIVYSDKAYDPGPSGTRHSADGYMLRFNSPEWNFLAPSMDKNAEWLATLTPSDDNLVIRYEDLYLDFVGCSERLSRFVGGFANPLPDPVVNRRRSYWSEQYASAFDPPALAALWKMFRPGIEKFYPERVASVTAAL